MAARPEMTRLLEQIGKETIKGKAIHLLAESVEAGEAGFSATDARNAIKTKPQVAATTATAAPDATDLPTALALINELKADFNALRAALLA